MRALTFAVPATTLATSPGLQLAYDLCFWGVYTNILLMTFNLIPLPPLDGFTILMGLFAGRNGVPVGAVAALR